MFLAQIRLSFSMPEVPKARLNRAGVCNHSWIPEREPHSFGHLLRWPGTLGNVIPADFAPRARRGFRRPLARRLSSLLKGEFHARSLCRNRYEMSCRGIQVVALSNANSAESLCLLFLLGGKLLILAGEIANVFVIAVTGYVWRLLE